MLNVLLHIDRSEFFLVSFAQENLVVVDEDEAKVKPRSARLKVKTDEAVIEYYKNLERVVSELLANEDLE